MPRLFGGGSAVGLLGLLDDLLELLPGNGCDGLDARRLTPRDSQLGQRHGNVAIGDIFSGRLSGTPRACDMILDGPIPALEYLGSQRSISGRRASRRRLRLLLFLDDRPSLNCGGNDHETFEVCATAGGG